MATTEDFAMYVVEQLEAAGTITLRKMFGEYCIYLDGKVLGLLCNNQFYMKPTDAGRIFIGKDLVEGFPFPKANPFFLIDDQLENREWVCQLAKVSLPELHYPKPKKKKRAKRQ